MKKITIITFVIALLYGGFVFFYLPQKDSNLNSSKINKDKHLQEEVELNGDAEKINNDATDKEDIDGEKEENIEEEREEEGKNEKEESLELKISEFVKRMTISEKVGQMFLVGFSGASDSEDLSQMIKEKNVGGVILMGRNISSRQQLEDLIKGIKDSAKQTNLRIPLFISVDQEGGVVSRVKVDKVKELASQSSIKNNSQAYLIAQRRAKELTSLGFNVNFSPVLDVIDDPDSFMYNRTFRASLDKLSSLGSSMVKGYQDSGLISSAKHFPGHNNNSVDSHKELPKINLKKEDLDLRLELFKDVISRSEPEMIMIGHLLYENLDANNPSSLSKKIIDKILKQDLSYKGIVITDDMEMRALTNNYSVSQASVMAVQAGNDILLYSGANDTRNLAYRAVVEAVKDGRIEEKRIDESVFKIIKLKVKNLGFVLY